MEITALFIIPGAALVGGFIGYTAAYIHNKFLTTNEEKTQRSIERALVSEEDVQHNIENT